MKVCLGTVIYKQAEVFFNDLVESVDNQTEKSFDLLITNDNYETSDLVKLGLLKEENDEAINSNLVTIDGQIHFLNLKEKGCSIAGTRIEMIRYAKSLGYDLLIVTDADDTFYKDRVEAFKQAYQLDKTYAFYYNKLVTADGIDILKDMPETVTSVRPISQENFLGMSIGAINLNLITEDYIDTLYEGVAAAFDWYFYSRLLMDVGNGKLVKGGATIYRIYDGNEVGTTHDVNQEYQVKLTHYQNLAKRYPYFKHLYQDLKNLDIDSIDISHDHNGYWWSNIKMEDSYEI